MARRLAEFIEMSMDQRWLDRTPEAMLETFHWFRGEAFHLIVEDLLDLAATGAVIAEGFRLLPHLVRPLLAESRRAVWLLPTPEFRRSALESRDSMWTIAGKTSDAQRALRNLLERDRMFTDRLRDDTKRLGLRSIEVDVGMTEDELAMRLAGAFGI